MSDATTPVTIGDVVVDRETTSNAEAVVVNKPPVTAADWHVGGRTVARDNPGYPADELVAVVVFRETLERAYPHYSGGRSLPLAQVTGDGVDSYAFPISRLRMVGELDPPEVSLTDIHPAPYHARSFRADENGAYVESIRERGRPESLPLLRDCGEHFEIIDGHKRVWASAVAGLDSIPCDCVYVDEFRAARRWAEQHLESYGPTERDVALRRLRERLGDRAHPIEKRFADERRVSAVSRA